MTKEERKARSIAQKLVDVLADFEMFNGDPALILDAIIWHTFAVWSKKTPKPYP